ncbi:MAG: hypothetical protein ACK5II_09235 [Paracoccus sp. (in: a-proteobacteria)]
MPQLDDHVFNRFAVGLVSLLLLAALFGRIMGYDLRRDEFMFVPPAAMLGQYDLYGDLFYNHVPYSAWLFRVMHLLLPWLGLLAVARLTIFLAWLFLLGTAAWISYRLTRSHLIACFSALSILTAEVFLGQTGMAAGNNLLPLPFALLGLGLFVISLVERDLSAGRLFLAGVMLSLAAGMKASAVAFIPAAAIGCFLLPLGLRFGQRLRQLVLPVAIGGAVGAIPLFWLAFIMPDQFFAHVLGYHSGPHVDFWKAHADSEPGLAMSAGQKLQLAYSVWFSGASLLALFVMLLTQVFVHVSKGGFSDRDTNGAIVVIVTATLSAALLGLVPTPGFPQYYAAPLIGIPLLTALSCRGLSARMQDLIKPVFVLAGTLMLLLAGPRFLVGLNDLRHPDGWTPVRVERGGEALRDALNGAGPVATLSPIYPLEAGLPIYPELSAGPFAYRVASYTRAALRMHYSMTGPDDVSALLDRIPPAGILTGFDPVLETTLEFYARTHGYVSVPIPEMTDRYGSAVLWVPSGSAIAAVSATVQTGDNP